MGKQTIKKETLSLIDKNKVYPFKEKNRNQLSVSIKRLLDKLMDKKIINHKYSAHDFRHYFACNHYKKNKDIVALKNLLVHANISVTDIYLQSVGLNNI